MHDTCITAYSWPTRRVTIFGPKMGQIALNGTNPGFSFISVMQIQLLAFLRSVSVHFGSPSQNVLKLILKSPRFVPLGAKLTDFGFKSDSPEVYIQGSLLTLRTCSTRRGHEVYVKLYQVITPESRMLWHKNAIGYQLASMFCILASSLFLRDPPTSVLYL